MIAIAGGPMQLRIPSCLRFTFRIPMPAGALVLAGLVIGGSIHAASAQAGQNTQDPQDTQSTQRAASTQSEPVEHPNKEATEYVLAHTDRESMVWVPMRDGVRLSTTL